MKNSFNMALLFASIVSFSLQAMEQKELSKKEAEDLYWNLPFPKEKYGVEVLDYPIYRANLMRAIPYLNFTQNSYHNPLSIAVKARDLEFTKFLFSPWGGSFSKGYVGQNCIGCSQ